VNACPVTFSWVFVVNPTLNSLETGLLTVESKLPFQPRSNLPKNPFIGITSLIWNHSPFTQNHPFPLLRITPFSSFQPSPCHTPKDDGPQIGGKPPRSYSSWLDACPTTRFITVRNSTTTQSTTRTESLSYHTQCRSRLYENRAPSTYHPRELLSTMCHFTDVPINSRSTRQHCLAKASGPGRSAVGTSPLPGEAYSHCLARTDVRARALSVEALALLFSS
jgi:hypothetical protein